MENKSNTKQAHTHIKDIVLLFSVPALIIAVLLGAIYIPRLFAHPTYDFVYCSGSACDLHYAVDPSGKIDNTDYQEHHPYFDPATLNYYDVSEETTRPITINEARSLKLDQTSRSPDGYMLELRRNTAGPFSASYDDTWTLRNGILSKPVTLAQQKTNNSFVGWVLP